eukprot:TRINITY_DN1006_c0_g1_i1.p1 TRINITY_DN1006_c0_g1~~TRINITY_DN1006_c0_g1_i1.p1  ORF type:complete len:595 (-),score=101.40 TRINITY_DN1006_c0_g1_i1:32-1681(-)
MEQAAPPVPTNWKAVGPTQRERTVELTFAVKQQGLVELHDTLMRVSTPSSPTYGQHLTNEQVQALTAPRPEHVNVVTDFIRRHGALPRKATPNGDIIVADVSVQLAETMLDAKYVQLRHGTTGSEVTRTPAGYSLPANVAAAVDFVSPTVHVPGTHRPILKTGRDLNSSTLGFNTPKNLRQLYNIKVEGKAETNRMAVTAFLEQYYDESSLKRFWSWYCGGIACGKGLPKLIGDATKGGAGTESMLDIESITGVAGNVASEFWGFSGRSSDNKANEPFMKWLEQLSSTSDANVPKIFSTSYGEDEGSWSYPAAQRLNVEFQKAGARGISILFASGDEGANCKGDNERFVPEGPGSSPYVTAVGGTSPSGGWPKPKSEKAVSLSSGGFSNYWPMPEYQKAAVADYLKQPGLPGASRGYNTSGRAYPDISAQASNFIVIAGLIPQPYVAGTSCATPVASGIFALLNDLRLQSSKSTLGFLNPLIYEQASSFNDITTGVTSGCGGFGGDGWPAKQGWDAATGVGTPDYAKLADAIAALPAGRLTVADTAVLV